MDGEAEGEGELLVDESLESVCGKQWARQAKMAMRRALSRILYIVKQEGRATMSQSHVEIVHR